VSLPINPETAALPRLALPRVRARRRLVLAPGWPLAAAYVGYPLWWFLGLRSFIFLVAAVPMGFALLGRRRLLAPRGFGAWLLFIAWVVGGLALLGVHAPGAKESAFSTRYFTAAYRLAWYAALTIVVLYVGNLSERELPTRRICRWLSSLFIVTVIGGYLGVVAPHFQFTSPLEHLAPSSVAQSDFFKSLTHPVAAQVQDFLGYAQGRPAAPYYHANDWGANFGLLLPFFVLEWFRHDGGRRRWVGIGVAVAATVPVIESLNRGLWIGLGLMALFVVFSATLNGHYVALGGLLAATAVVAVLIVATPLQGTIQARLGAGQSNSVRAQLASRTVADVAHTSPIVGFGSTRNVQGNFNTIGGGATPSCPHCSPPAMGTQGHLWLVLFGQGFVGAALFFWFLVRRFVPYMNDHRPFAVAACASFVFFIVVIWVYDLLDVPLVTLMLGLAVLWRMQRPNDGADESTVYDPGAA
jgi:hypothetical protein